MNTGLDLGMLGRKQVRLVRQTEVAECGLACLAMIAIYHGLHVDLAGLRRRFEPSLRGASLRSLIGVADGLGFAPRAVKLRVEQLDKLHLPAILHWDMNHYVVLERIRGTVALIRNPAGGPSRISISELSEHFTGVALELRPTSDFRPVELRARLRLGQLWHKISGLKRAIVQTLMLSLVLQAFVLALPYYLQIAIDSALPALDRNLLTVLAVGFAGFTIINSAAAFLRAHVLLSAGTAIGYGISANIARKLFRLPLTWFEKRHTGDVLSRFQSVGPIRQFLTEGAVSAVLDGALAIFTLALMAIYSPILTALAVVAFVLYGTTRAISFPLQRRAQEAVIMNYGQEQSTLIESLRGITTLRMSNRESQRYAFWQTKLIEASNASVHLSRLNIWQQTANGLIFGLETVLSIWLAINLVISGGFSVGMVFAYMSYKTQFIDKTSSLIDQLVLFRMIGLHLERLSDIALAEQDISFQREQPFRELRGKIELCNITFQYGTADPHVLKGASIMIEPGEHVAITGTSGGGKSTLLKILLGLIEPTEGTVLVDGLPLENFGYKNFSEQVGAVLQDDTLFAGSLADNIALFDEAPSVERIHKVARMAAIHDEIMAMPMGYETLVGDMGSSLSGGQRQRILLARALYREPRLLVMDEGTSALDVVHEQSVNEAIAQLGITRVVVAHRIETIMFAERVYAVEGGRVLEVTEQFRPVEDRLRHS